MHFSKLTLAFCSVVAFVSAIPTPEPAPVPVPYPIPVKAETTPALVKRAGAPTYFLVNCEETLYKYENGFVKYVKTKSSEILTYNAGVDSWSQTPSARHQVKFGATIYWEPWFEYSNTNIKYYGDIKKDTSTYAYAGFLIVTQLYSTGGVGNLYKCYRDSDRVIPTGASSTGKKCKAIYWCTI